MPSRHQQLLQRLCLRPTFSLRRQLLVSFGSSALLTLALVVMLTSLFVIKAGEGVRNPVSQTTRRQALNNFHVASRNQAAQLTRQMENIEGNIQLMVEFVRDRIVGYPFLEDDDADNGNVFNATSNPSREADHDKYVPFRNHDTGIPQYPLNVPPLPVDWQIYWNVVPTTAEEHLQERAKWLRSGSPTSTATASWLVQGVCDPSLQSRRDSNHWAYYPNCTEANNDMSTGGAVQPTRTARYLHDVSGDLGVLLKPLYEAQFDSFMLFISFFNDGAGATIQFPGVAGRNDGTPYVSEGCDWLLETINPYTGRPLGTPEQVKRCHPAGSLVDGRAYNPVERPWFRTITEASVGGSERAISHGPFLTGDSAFSAIMYGKALYDRRTGEFLGVASQLMASVDLIEAQEKTRLHEYSDHSIVRFDSGIVWADSIGTHAKPISGDVNVWDTGLITQSEWETLRDAVDYGRDGSNKTNSREAINRRMVEATFTARGVVKMAYPLRLPPKEYDVSYQPEFLVIHYLPEAPTFKRAFQLSSDVEDDVEQLLMLTGGIGLLGVILVLATVWWVSRMLTYNLVKMERVAWKIVNHAKNDYKRTRSSHKKIDSRRQQSITIMIKRNCFPRNEISCLVQEFEKMIRGFSGSGAALVAEAELAEVQNLLTWHSEFRTLYEESADPEECAISHSDLVLGASSSMVSVAKGPGLSQPAKESSKARKRVSFSERRNSIERFELPKCLQLPADLCVDSTVNTGSSRSFVPAPRRLNAKPNTKRHNQHDQKIEHPRTRIRVWRSPLFWGILLTLTVPLLMINSIICGVIFSKTREMMPEWVDNAEEASRKLESDSLETLAKSKALYAESALCEPVGSTHLLTRMTGWLYFDSIQRAETLTSLTSGTEECKVYPNDRSCPYYSPENTPCPCTWKDFSSEFCQKDAFDPSTDTRYLQRTIYAVQARDADPETGARTSAGSFPTFDDRPNSTLWWDDPSTVPGASKGSSSSGFSTLYDRLRVGSALSVVEFPIYNYVTSLGRENSGVGTFLGFEEDGLFLGFPGCDYNLAQYAHFQSNPGNRASVIAPHLCPLGKYGYDPRCRSWYAEGLQSFRENREVVYLTPPYRFVQNLVGMSVVSPIVNLRTNELVGNVLYDFLATDIQESFADVKKNIVTFLITPILDTFEHDTVIGPDNVIGARIEELMLPNDNINSKNRKEFKETVLEKMKAGETGVGDYKRTNESGDVESFIVAYAPVFVRSLTPLEHGDFTRGVANVKKLVYSGAMAVREEDLRRPFRSIETELQSELIETNTTFFQVICFVSTLFVAFTCLVTAHIVWPIVLLLRTLERINDGKVDRIPPMDGGSLEVRQIYSTFAKLCRAVRTSNIAFFSGNIEFASHIIDDALQLYRKIHNTRAVGVACNNLANTFHATLHSAKIHGVVTERNTSCSDLMSALSLYDEAIQIADNEFKSETDMRQKARFSEQLADRLFNRGLFLMLAEGEEDCPEDATQRGLADISRARQLDYDVRGYWLEMDEVHGRSANLFSRMVRRLNGLVTFYDNEELRAAWDAKELVNDADDLLSACSAEPNSSVFEDLTLTGRLQQLEAAVIRLEMWLKNFPEAARMGIRMFAEDEFVLETSFQTAAAAILNLNQNSTDTLFSPKVITSMKSDIRSMIRSCKSRPTISISKCLIISLELSGRWDLDPILDDLNSNLLQLYDEGCSDDDLMGFVSFPDQGDELTIGLGLKSENAGLHKSTLDIASNSTSRTLSPTLPVALQMVVDSEETLDHDTFILLVSDGTAWYFPEIEAMYHRLHRLNTERSTDIHVIVMGLGLTDKRTLAMFEKLGSLTPESAFMQVDSGNVDSAFREATQLLWNDFQVRADLQGITMEEF